MENHIAAVFDCFGLSYERGATTEHGQKPDFLFPGAVVYMAAPAGDARLLMLGAKSTCKDRWRQVLAEAAKIPNKHLLTLEPGITEPQTSQMEAANLQLVVPAAIHSTYSQGQKAWLWSLGQFIAEAQARGLETPKLAE